MGGEILVFSADKYFDAGKAEGIVEGIVEGRAEGKAEGIIEGRAEGKVEGKAEGKAEGRVEGEEMLGKLITMLIMDGRSDEVVKAASDKEYRTLLYKDYAIS